MSDRPIGDDLDQQLRLVMKDLADASPLVPEYEDAVSLLRPGAMSEERSVSKRTWIATGAAAAVVITVIVVGALVLNEDDEASVATAAGGAATDAEADTADVAPEFTQEDVVGIWRAQPPGSFVEYRDDETYRIAFTVDGLEDAAVESGSFTVEGTVFTFVSDEHTFRCAPGDRGVYELERTAEGFRQVLVEDDCSVRSSVAPVDHTPVPLTQEDVVGIWRAQQPGSFVKYRDNGTYGIAYTLDGLANDTVESGVFSVEGTEFIFVSDEQSVTCAPGDRGVYELERTADGFRQVLVEDDCTLRASFRTVDHTPVPVTQEDVVGIWRAQQPGSFVEYREDGTYSIAFTVDGLADAAVESGSFTVEGTEFTLLSDEDTSSCAPGDRGVYELERTADGFRQVLVEDDCSARSSVAPVDHTLVRSPQEDG